MNNKEWLEIKLTKEQLELLENFNLVTTNGEMYILGLGEFYKIISNDNPYKEKYYMTTNLSLLPEYALDVYKEIITGQYKKLNNEQ